MSPQTCPVVSVFGLARHRTTSQGKRLTSGHDKGRQGQMVCWVRSGRTTWGFQQVPAGPFGRASARSNCHAGDLAQVASAREHVQKLIKENRTSSNHELHTKGDHSCRHPDAQLHEICVRCDTTGIIRRTLRPSLFHQREEPRSGNTGPECHRRCSAIASNC